MARADRWAAVNGLTVETATGSPAASLAKVSDIAVAAGVLAVLAVLAMTIGLIRSETSTDLRVLAATGASGRTRRMLTGATAAALALLGGLLGTAAAYLAIIAWNRGIHSLANVSWPSCCSECRWWRLVPAGCWPAANHGRSTGRHWNDGCRQCCAGCQSSASTAQRS